MAYVYKYNDEPDAVKTVPKLRTNRKGWKLMILTICTLGIYMLFFYSEMAYDMDKVAHRSDGKKTMPYTLAVILALFTLSIVTLVWFHSLCRRIGDDLDRRKINYDFGPRHFWIWYQLVPIVGPWIFSHKICTAMNLLCEDYNKNM